MMVEKKYISEIKDLMQEWDYEANKDLDPTKLTIGSHKKVWWKCLKCGYEWKAIIQNRTRHNSGCPVCVKSSGVILGITDVFTTNPELKNEWNFEKNININPQNFKAGSEKKVWWVCKNCNNEWQATIYSRSKGCGCPKCNATNKTSFPEQVLYFYIKKLYPDTINSYKPKFLNRMELDIFIPSLNLGIEYDGSHWHKKNTLSKELIKYKLCKENNIKLIRIKEKRVKGDSNAADKIIEIKDAYDNTILENSIKILLNHISFFNGNVDINILKDSEEIFKNYKGNVKDSLQDLYPEIAKEWHPTKNGKLIPSNFKKGSEFKAWWKCSKCGYEWCTSIKHRTGKKKNGCPNCAMKQIEPPKAVEMIDIKSGKVIQEFSSIRIAKKITNISDSNIVEVCKERRKTAGGYIWRYKK